MNEQPKSKVFIIIIGILLIANIVMLAFFIISNKHKEQQIKDRPDRSAYIIDYLKKEVGFNAGQLARYDSLSKQHREQIKSNYKALSAERKNILTNLAGTSFSDSGINIAANGMHDQQKALEFSMLMYIRNIRNICTDPQRPVFDTGFYKIMGRRGEPRKEK